MSSATAYAPGRVELLGNHTDYNGGLVLAAAIDRGLTVAGSEREDERISLHSVTLDRHFATSLSSISRTAEEPWADYPLGVIDEMRIAGFTLRGFEATISGNLPVGGGLSSSAALEVATATFLCRLNKIAMPKLELAKLCHRAETRFVGVPSGLLDQITVIYGQADQAVFIDCQSEEVQLVPIPAGTAFIIADSGTKHELVAGDYATRRAECVAAAESFGVTSLRELTLRAVQIFEGDIDPVLRRRALHIAGENERVHQSVDAFASGDAVLFGALMNASHESSRLNFENSTPELDLLTSIARALPGVLGARLTGGGFGGSAVILARKEGASAAIEQLSERYRSQTGIEASPFVTKASNGAG
jgi:galactokinase